jgi:hypothetical protein
VKGVRWLYRGRVKVDGFGVDGSLVVNRRVLGVGTSG